MFGQVRAMENNNMQITIQKNTWNPQAIDDAITFKLILMRLCIDATLKEYSKGNVVKDKDL